MFVRAVASIVVRDGAVTVDACDLLLVLVELVAENDGGFVASTGHLTALHQVRIFEVVLFLLLLLSGAHNLHAA